MMQTTSYELVSIGGRSVYAADTLPIALTKRDDLAKRGTYVSVERVQVTRVPVFPLPPMTRNLRQSGAA